RHRRRRHRPDPDGPGGLGARADPVGHRAPRGQHDRDRGGGRPDPRGARLRRGGVGGMKLKSDLTINGKLHRKGEDAPKWFIYPFFLLHMAVFGLSGFFMAYATDGPPLAFIYAHGGIAIFAYVVFY